MLGKALGWGENVILRRVDQSSVSRVTCLEGSTKVKRPWYECLKCSRIGMRGPRCRRNKLQRGGTLELDKSSNTHRALILLIKEFYN